MKRLALLLPLLALSTVLVLASCLGTGCVLMANLGLMRLDSERRISIRERVAAGDLSVLDKVRKSDVNYVFDDGTTLLFDGVASQNSNIVASLVARGANVNKRAEGPRYSEFDRFDMSFAGWTPLMLAVSESAPSCWATEKASAEPDAANARAIVRILLDHRADPSAMIGDWTFPITPLSLALQKEDSYSYPLLDELLAAGADPDPIVWGTNTVLDLMTAHCNGLKKVVGARPEITAERLERYEKRILYLRAASTNAPAPASSPATPRPAEETHAESAENAEPEPHAESAEGAESLAGRAPSRPGEGSGEAEPSPSVAPPPAP